MLAVAGITSLVGLLESVTNWVDERFSMSRHTGTALVVGTVTLCSLASVLSYNVWEDVRVAGMNFNDFADALSSKVMLPLTGLMVALFAGWFMARRHSEEELATTAGSYALWLNLTRYLVVPAVAVILVSGLI
jgi:NSS family neurotransmitter:Na+ symporter